MTVPWRLTETEKADPRIVARRAEIEATELPALVAAHEQRYTEWLAGVERAEAETKQREAAKQAEHEAKLVPYQAAIRELASHEVDLARAAAENYSVERVLLNRLAARLLEQVTRVVACPIHTAVDCEAYTDPKDRAAPSLDAFDLLDAVTQVVLVANDALPLAVGRWTVSRIVRVDACPHAGEEDHWVTAVLATLQTPTCLRQITFSTESLECEHEEVE